MRLPRMFTPRTIASAHCDLPCGVYDPAQARIEAESIKGIIAKVADNSAPDLRTRAGLADEPAQARGEAESIKGVIAKGADNSDPDFRTRAVLIKEQRSDLVKHHLWVLWTDYFKPPHLEQHPQRPQLLNPAPHPAA